MNKEPEIKALQLLLELNVWITDGDYWQTNNKFAEAIKQLKQIEQSMIECEELKKELLKLKDK